MNGIGGHHIKSTNFGSSPSQENPLCLGILNGLFGPNGYSVLLLLCELAPLPS